MKKQQWSSILALMPVMAYALETELAGNFNVNITLAQEEDKYQWNLFMPENYLALSAVEPVGSLNFEGFWQVKVDPLASNRELTLQQGYIGATAGYVSVYAGRIAGLDKTFVLEPSRYLDGLENGGLQFFDFYDLYQNNAVRTSSKLGDYLEFDVQMVLDDEQDSLPWSVAAAITTYEGSFAVTYHQEPDQDPRWTNQATYITDGSAIGYAWIYQEGIIGYSIDVRTDVRPYTFYLGYTRNTDIRRWHVGSSQKFSETVNGYSELFWEMEESQLSWVSGIKMTF